ncbi:MAG: HAD hydrolase-like protein [Candidatus Omnitrophota bacterium]
MWHKIVNVMLVMVSICVACLLGEVLIRAFHLGVWDKAEEKDLMWGDPNFETDASGAVRFAKNASVRELAVYGDHIEYSIFYKTNNMGFVDDIDYGTGVEPSGFKKKIAFVGDSFSVGSAGYPWVTQLRHDLAASGKQIMIYNFSVPGTGVQHFARLLNSVSRELEFSDIYILGISAAFERPFWTPLTESGGLFYCKGGDCRDKRRAASIVGSRSTPEEILEQLKSVRAARHAASGPRPAGGRKGWLKSSELLHLVYHQIWLARFSSQKQGVGMEGLRQIREKFRCLGLDQWVDTVIFTDDLGPGQSKPSVIPFQLMCSALGVSSVSSCYVGDNPVKDFLGANQIGMLTIRLHRGMHQNVLLKDPAGMAKVTVNLLTDISKL